MGTETTGNGADNRVLDLILKGIDQLRGDVKDLRDDVAAGDALRVSKESFLQYQTATEARIARLEATPMRVLAWLGVGTGTLGPIITVILWIASHPR